MIDEHGISIRLYERPGGTTVYMSFQRDGEAPSAETRREAEELSKARERLEESQEGEEN
jgi:hypothetical protein